MGEGEVDSGSGLAANYRIKASIRDPYFADMMHMAVDPPELCCFVGGGRSGYDSSFNWLADIPELDTRLLKYREGESCCLVRFYANTMGLGVYSL
jgi:hypothetical protein